MKPFIKFEGTIVPIMNDNIDTDQLIPKQYLKSTEKQVLESIFLMNGDIRKMGVIILTSI